MGRSPFFSIDTIVRPPIEQTESNLKMIQTLQSLNKGQCVRITLESTGSVCRSISVYEYEPSPISSYIVYDVISTNFQPELADINLYAIALKDPTIIDSKHIIGWVITTDGYIRESEHYTIKYKLKSIEIVN